MRDPYLPHQQALEQERDQILRQWEEWLEFPMLLLSLIWLALFIVELLSRLNPFLQAISNAIWIIFILDFGLEFLLAPRKVVYLKRNWLLALSLVLPAFRAFRIVRAMRVFRTASATRGLRLLRLVTRANQGMQSLSATVQRRGFAYVLGLTLIVTVLGAAGMYAFEMNAEGGGLASYSDALWWTAMLMTTLGSEYFPKTPEGRILCFVLALYAFAVFGYVTATLATFFIDRDAADSEAELVGTQTLEALRAEIVALRKEIQLSRQSLDQ